jgi:hypothetical protein
MFSATALHIELHRRGTVTALDIQDDRAVIGSGSHCDVRLAPDEAAVEQLLVEVLGDDVYLRARAADPPCRLNGVPFFEGRVVPTSLVEFGGVGICVSAVAREDSRASVRSGRTSSTSPVMQALGVVAVALGLYAVTHPPSGNVGLALAAMTPPPPDSLQGEACPEQEPGAALALAEQLAAQAEIKRERAPFYAGDALLGAPLFERAARCYDVARSAVRRDVAHEAALGLQAQTTDQIHLAHVRIERSLAEKNYAGARRNAELALTLLSNPSHPYAQWLKAVMRDGLLRARAEAKR